MIKITFKKLRKPPPGFFGYLVKALIGLGIWLLMVSVVHIYMGNGKAQQPGDFAHFLGSALLVAFLIVIGGIYLFSLDYATFSTNRKLLLLAAACLLAVLLFELCIFVPLSPYLFPLVGIGMLASLLLGVYASFVLTLILSLVFGIIIRNDPGYFLTLFLGCSVAIIVTARARRRSRILNAGALVGIVNCIVIVCLGFYRQDTSAQLFRDGAWGFASGLAASFLTMGLLPVFEALFNCTTDITLLELSDLNSPLLKDLILKAPGTYHHSLIVGNLAEAACAAVGANSLLARVGAYYHDIGKLDKPDYFSENEAEVKSRHQELTPTMSALIIINHVKDGLELARRHKLPQAIREFIAEHHGSSLIYFFYQRALEKVKDESLLKEEDFRYPGPKPQTREAAIVLLADAVEASSRTLTDPTPSRIEALTQRIINNKFIDGQLNECDLSLKDLHTIADSFTKILTGLFHSRVKYPTVSSAST